MKLFFLFLLAITFTLHAAEEGSATLPDNSPTAINDAEASLTSDNDQETDPSFKEKESRYVVVSQKNSSPLMMFSEKGKENSEKKPLSVEDLTEQQRRNSEPQNSSAAISRSPNPAAISEKRNSASSKPTLPELCSLLFKTLIYCPGCKQWHTAANISKKTLNQVLLIKNPKTDFWHPVYHENPTTPQDSSLQKFFLQFMDQSSSKTSIEKRNFQFITDSENEQVLYHADPITGTLKKSGFQDPINALPAFSYWTSFLLQARSLMPDSLAHSLLIRTLEQEQNTLQSPPPVQKNEKTPLLPKGVVPTGYSSISPKK